MLNLVGLQGFGARYPHELSGGMKQRVSIARGLVQDPPVLLMDEPFAALDEQTRMTMGHELLRIWSQTAKTVVFVTHSLTEAVYLADEVLVMSARPGRIIDRIAVPLPRPRTYEMMGTETFAKLRDRIWQQIRKEGDDCVTGAATRSRGPEPASGRLGGVRAPVRTECDAPAPHVRWLISRCSCSGSCSAHRHHPRAVPAAAVEGRRGAGEGLARVRRRTRGHALRGRVRDADRLRRRHSLRRAGRRHRAACATCCCRCSPACTRCRS
jgi:hypothetical protein